MSSRDPLRSALDQALLGANRVLWLGDKRLAPPSAVLAREPAEAPNQPFDAIGWVARTELRDGLARLRERLLPGGVLVLVLGEPFLLNTLTRALRLAPKADTALLSQACEALLCSGFAEPRVISSGQPRFLLRAQKPKAPCALDALFAQPSR